MVKSASIMRCPGGKRRGTARGTWTVVSGTLPPGLDVFSELSLWGARVDGTPTTGGTFTFTLQVSDDKSQASREYTVTIADGSVSHRYLDAAGC